MAEREARLIAQLAELLRAQTVLTAHTYDCPWLLASAPARAALASPSCSPACRQVRAACASPPAPAAVG